MLRSGLLWLSERRSIFNFAKRNGLARRFATRFVAGETLDQAVAATRDLNARDITTSLDLLGESVHNPDEAQGARNEVLSILDRIRGESLLGNVSVKLTQMGLDIDPALAAGNMTAILERARAHGIFVRIDMESSEYVERTLEIFRSTLHPVYGDLVGVVIQAMLRRSGADIEDLIRRRARVRLVKGAYKEPPPVAFPAKKDVDRAFTDQSERLLSEGNYPAIATHDERLIEHVKRYSEREGIGRDRFEFQMLYGVRRDLQDNLRRQGYHVRVYVPFGTEWYPYLMRRLAERPANVAFIMGSVMREAFGRK